MYFSPIGGGPITGCHPIISGRPRPAFKLPPSCRSALPVGGDSGWQALRQVTVTVTAGVSDSDTRDAECQAVDMALTGPGPPAGRAQARHGHGHSIAV